MNQHDDIRDLQSLRDEVTQLQHDGQALVALGLALDQSHDNIRAEMASLFAIIGPLCKALEQFAIDDNWHINSFGNEWTWDGDGDPRTIATDALRNAGARK